LTPTSAGDVLLVMPMNPELLVGTRLSQYSSLYEKYKHHDVVFEYVPSIPATQDGSLIMFCVYDVQENYSVTTNDQTELMRLALGHEGANIFNVYDYGRTTLFDTPDSLKSYYLDVDGGDAREEMQAYLVIVAGSNYTNTSTGALTLGCIVAHYCTDFHCRAISRVTSNIATTLYNFAANPSNTTFETLISTGGVGLVVSIIGVAAKLDQIFMIRVVSDVKVGGNTQRVYDETGEMTLMSKGSIWYGRVPTEGVPAYMKIFSSLEGAMEMNLEGGQTRWVFAVSTTTMTGYIEIQSIPITQVNNE